MNTLREINYILDRTQKLKLVIMFAVIVIGGFMELIGVSLILPLVNIIMNEDYVRTAWWAVTISSLTGITGYRALICSIIIGMIAIFVMKNIYIIFMNWLIYKFTADNRARLSARLLRVYVYRDYSYHLNQNVADLQRNISVDVTQFYSVISNALNLLNELFTSFLIVVYLLTMDVSTTVAVTVILVVTISAFYRLQRRRLARVGQINRGAQALVNKWMLQTFNGIKEVKILNREEFFLERCERYYKEFCDVNRRYAVISSLPKPIMESIVVCGILLVIVVRIMLGADIGGFLPVLGVFAVAAFRMLPSFNRITGYLNNILFQKASVHSLYRDIREAEAEEKTLPGRIGVSEAEPMEFRDAIRIKNLSFRYPGTSRWILRDVSLTIPRHSSIAIIGPSGIGKSTLADILLGLLHPDEGEVTVDDMDVGANAAMWHRLIGYIPQAIYLMDDTIRANIAFGLPDGEVSDERIMRAVCEAQLKEFIDELPRGLDSMVGERGVRISGGQRQRIGIARALYSDPEVLIFDEATSSLDNETEEELMRSINEFKGTRTMIIIAHRLHTIRECDSIYEIEDGRLVERTHEEIFGVNGEKV